MSNSLTQKGNDTRRLIGGNLRALRLNRGFTQTQIASALGVSFQQVQKYETGQNRLPIDKLLKLKQFYNAPFDVFFEGHLAYIQNQYMDEDRTQNLFKKITSIHDAARQTKILRVIEVMVEG